jgi:LmbE family N-acetylglucosaminyl deacetylase
VAIDDARPSRVLAVYAHADDPEVSCGGTLARWAEGGADVNLVVVNAGEKGSNDPTTDPQALAATRADEVRAAAAVLGLAGVALLGHPDGETVNDTALREELVAEVRRTRPQIVVCPDPSALLFGDGYVNHRDHRVCGEAVLDAVAAAARPLYYPGVGGDAWTVATLYLSGTLEPDTWVDVGPTLAAKAAALACHRSQLGGTGEYVHELVGLRAEEAGRSVGLRAAETFRVLHLGG